MTIDKNMDINKYNTLQYSIDKHYLSEQLKSLYFNYLHNFEDEFGQEKKKSKDLKKTHIVDLMARVFSKKELFLTFLNYFPPEIIKMFKFLNFHNFKFPVEVLEKKFGVKLLDTEDRYVSSTSYYFMPTTYLLSFKTEYGSNKQIYLDKDIASIVREYLDTPEEYKLIESVKEPQTKYIYSDNGQIVEYLSLYLKAVDNIKDYDLPKKLSKGLVKAIYEQCKVDEFYKDSLKEGYSYLKTELIIHFIKSSQVFYDLPNLNILKKIFEVYQSGKGFYSYQLLYHIKNLSRYTDEYYYAAENEKLNRIFNTNIIELVKKMPLNKWVDFNNFYNAYLLHENKTYHLFIKQALDSIYFTQEAAYTYEQKVRIGGDAEYFTAIFEPALKGTFFLLATFGLIDIAYDKPQNILKQKGEEYLSVFDGLKAIRLTDLGAYILGLKKDYKVELKQENFEIKLSDTDLKIYLKGTNRVKMMFLDSFSQKISENIYKVDYPVFLKGCTNKKEIKNKIDLFKKEISPELPEVWLNFFKSTLSRGQSLEKEESFILYKLKDKNELANLFLRDEILKKYILKVEKMMIAIKKEDTNKVKKRLEVLGYLGSIL